MDGDGYIGTTDIEHALKLLTQNELSMDEIQCVWEKVRLEKFIFTLIFKALEMFWIIKTFKPKWV